jgi:hypothetical protein
MLIGTLVATFISRWLVPTLGTEATDVVLPSVVRPEAIEVMSAWGFIRQEAGRRRHGQGFE